MTNKNKMKPVLLDLLSDIRNSWLRTITLYSSKIIKISSEKSLVFNFAWLFMEDKNYPKYHIDFEKEVVNSEFGKFFDLYFEFKHYMKSIYSKQKIRLTPLRVAFEFKFLINNGGTTNQHKGRLNVFKDIKELSDQINKDKIDIGVFFLLTNEKAYTKKGNKSKSKKYLVHDQQDYPKGSYLPGKPSENKIKAPCRIKFKWKTVNKDHYYISPIIITKDWYSKKYNFLIHK